MATYRPPQRSITARILTASRWIRGTFHLPRLHSFLDYLGRGAFLRLTNVSLEKGEREVPFFALRRTSALAIAPECSEEELKLEVIPGAKPHPVDCLLQTGRLSGLLALLPNVRVSDYLMHQEGYVVLRHATFAPGSLSPPEPLPVLLLYSGALIGMSERNASAQAQERREPARSRPEPAARAEIAEPPGAKGTSSVRATKPERETEPRRWEPASEPEGGVESWVVPRRPG
jgi:hypothetical protein